MSKQETVIKFQDVSFEYPVSKKEILKEVRSGMKITLMGQNGAGKSTIFKLITGELKPDYGKIHIDQNMTIDI